MLDNYPFHILYFPSEKPVKHTKGAVTYTYNQGLYVISKNLVGGAYKRYHGTITTEGATWKTLSSVPTLPSFPKGNLIKDYCEENIKKILLDFFKLTPQGTIIESNYYKQVYETKSIRDITLPIIQNFFGEENVDFSGDTFLIYFDKLTVSNGNASHEMHDIYIRVNRMYDYKLMRTSLSDAERNVQYLFSHARKNGWGSYSDLCLGESNTPIAKSQRFFRGLLDRTNFIDSGRNFRFFEMQLSSNCLVPFNHINDSNSAGIPVNEIPEIESQAYIFCNNLLTYLQWESLSGGPYINLSSVINNANNSIDTTIPTVPDVILKEGFHRLMTTYKDKIIYEINTENGLVNIKCRFPPDVLLKACEYKFIKVGNRTVVYDSKLKSVEASKIPIKGASAILTFKGKVIYPLKVIPGINVSLDINSAFTPPIFHQYVQNKLINLITDVTSSFIKIGHRTSQT